MTGKLHSIYNDHMRGIVCQLVAHLAASDPRFPRPFVTDAEAIKRDVAEWGNGMVQQVGLGSVSLWHVSVGRVWEKGVAERC